MGGNHPFQGEAAQFFAQMAPGVEIPVVAIVDEALRGKVAFRLAASVAAQIADVRAAARRGVGQGLEDAGVRLPGGGAQHPHPAYQFTLALVCAVQEFFDALPERGEIEQAGLGFFEQFLRGQQGIQLGGREPEAWQFERGLGVAIAAVFRIMGDGGAEQVAHFREDTGERGARAFQFFFQAGGR